MNVSVTNTFLLGCCSATVLNFTIDTKLCSFNDTIKLECHYSRGRPENIFIQRGISLISIGCVTDPDLPDAPDYTITTCNDETIVLEIGSFTPAEEDDWSCVDISDGSYAMQSVENLECK